MMKKGNSNHFTQQRVDFMNPKYVPLIPNPPAEKIVRDLEPVRLIRPKIKKSKFQKH